MNDFSKQCELAALQLEAKLAIVTLQAAMQAALPKQAQSTMQSFDLITAAIRALGKPVEYERCANEACWKKADDHPHGVNGYAFIAPGIGWEFEQAQSWATEADAGIHCIWRRPKPQPDPVTADEVGARR